MKIIFLLILASPFSFGQNYNPNKEGTVDFFPLDSIIQDDWYLHQVDLYHDYYFETDTNKTTSLKNGKQKLTLTSDSIFITPDSTERYYYTINKYSYKIVYDSIFRANYIKLFEGKRKKQREVESYEIIKITLDELIIKSYMFPSHGLDRSPISILYSYRKEIDTTLSPELLDGNWLFCSEKYLDFYSDEDSSYYEFSRTLEDSLCLKFHEHSEMKFSKKSYKNTCSFRSYNENIFAVSGNIPYMLDVKNKLIYIGISNPKVFNIELKNKDKLIISLNKEKTKSLERILIENKQKKGFNSH